MQELEGQLRAEREGSELRGQVAGLQEVVRRLEAQLAARQEAVGRLEVQLADRQEWGQQVMADRDDARAAYDGMSWSCRSHSAF